MRRFQRIVLAALLICAATSDAIAEMLAPSQSGSVLHDNALEFTVMRGDEAIGYHRIDFRRNGDLLEVRTRARIAVEILFIRVYRFEWDSREVWRDGKLLSMASQVHDDGSDHTVAVSRNENGRLETVSDGSRSSVDGSTVPVSFWNVGIVVAKAHLNPLVGLPLNIRITYRGEEEILVHGKPVRAAHYSMTGELERELWYGPNMLLAKMTLIGSDGSLIRYIQK
jgi:hypothetical protein